MVDLESPRILRRELNRYAETFRDRQELLAGDFRAHIASMNNMEANRVGLFRIPQN